LNAIRGVVAVIRSELHALCGPPFSRGDLPPPGQNESALCGGNLARCAKFPQIFPTVKDITDWSFIKKKPYGFISPCMFQGVG
jgi:hypothetical protein